MKFWGIFSRTTFRLFARRTFRKLKANSIEAVLARSVRLLDQETVTEIKKYIKSQQTIEGGFADRGGKCDLYYSLFGWYIAEALGIEEIKPSLKEYLKNVTTNQKLSGIHQKCAVILFVKLFGNRHLPPALRKPVAMAAQYSDFLNMLAYYYSEDYKSLFFLKNKFKSSSTGSEIPCSVAAANLIINDLSGKKDEKSALQLKDYYRNGSFAAFRKTPHGDILSTGVALFAQRFVNSELSIIKPDCLTYIDSLYSEGGFSATDADPVPDVEYTFYGLLGLGSLSD
jgi:hypothetical protein